MRFFAAKELAGRFNISIGYWIQCCYDYSLDELRSKPGADSWSLGQLIRHIIQDTGFHIKQLSIALTDLQNTDRLMHPDGIVMLKNNEFPDRKITGHPDNASILQPNTKEEILVELRALQNQVQLLVTSPGFGTQMGKSEHPGLGFFTATEWLQFTEMHMRHHLRQKKRIDDFLLSRKTSS